MRRRTFRQDIDEDRLARAAWRAVESRIAPGPAATPAAIGSEARRRLERALRRERALGRAGHWSYDLNRHLALLQALAGDAETPAKTKEAPPCGDAS